MNFFIRINVQDSSRSDEMSLQFKNHQMIMVLTVRVSVLHYDKFIVQLVVFITCLRLGYSIVSIFFIGETQK